MPFLKNKALNNNPVLCVLSLGSSLFLESSLETF